MSSKDDVEIYPEFGRDLDKLIEQAPAGPCLGHLVVRACPSRTLGALMVAHRLVSFADVHCEHEGGCNSRPGAMMFENSAWLKAILQLASAGTIFQPREPHFDGTGRLDFTVRQCRASSWTVPLRDSRSYMIAEHWAQMQELPMFQPSKSCPLNQ